MLKKVLFVCESVSLLRENKRKTFSNPTKVMLPDGIRTTTPKSTSSKFHSTLLTVLTRVVRTQFEKSLLNLRVTLVSKWSKSTKTIQRIKIRLKFNRVVVAHHMLVDISPIKC